MAENNMFCFLTLVKSVVTTNRFGRYKILMNIIDYYSKNTVQLEELNNAYNPNNQEQFVKLLKKYIKTIKAGHDVKFRTYQVIKYILEKSNDSSLKKIQLDCEPPVNKLHRQEEIVKSLLSNGKSIGDLAEDYGTDEKTIRNDIKDLKSGQGLLKEYLHYLPDTGEKLGLNIGIEKEQVRLASRVVPLKLLLSLKELYTLISLLRECADLGRDSSVYAERVLGEITRNSSEFIEEFMYKSGLELEVTDLDKRLNQLMDDFILIDSNYDFKWPRFKIRIECFEDGQFVSEQGHILEFGDKSIIFKNINGKERKIRTADIIEICSKG